MILLIDNYDSFAHNLARYVKQLGFDVLVKRNDSITLDDIKSLMPEKIIISPGPCDPSHSGVCLEVVRHFGCSTPILGVCLGHQAIAQAYGARIVRASAPVHGKSSVIEHASHLVFKDIPRQFKVGRYHSLTVSHNHFPSDLDIIAHVNQDEIMAIAHKVYPVIGVQFHPESVLTEYGYELLDNFLNHI